MRGRIPLSVLRKYNMITYWTKILKSNDNSIIKGIYKMVNTDAINNIKYDGLNWAFHNIGYCIYMGKYCV